MTPTVVWRMGRRRVQRQEKRDQIINIKYTQSFCISVFKISVIFNKAVLKNIKKDYCSNSSETWFCFVAE